MTYLDYVKAAFNVRYPVPKIGRLPVNWLALAVIAILGVPFPALLFIGTAAEIAFLYLLSSNPRFQRLVTEERKASAQATAAEKQAALAGALSRPSRERLAGLETHLTQIQSVSQTMRPVALGPLDEAQLSGLTELHSIFLRLLVSEQTLEGYLESGAKAEVEKELTALKAELERDGLPEQVRKSKQATLDILQRRQANLDKAQEQRQFVEAELNRIEAQVSLILDDAMLTRDPATLSAKIDEVAANLGETNEWIRANADLLGAVEDTLPAPPQAPQPPPAQPQETEKA